MHALKSLRALAVDQGDNNRHEASRNHIRQFSKACRWFRSPIDFANKRGIADAKVNGTHNNYNFKAEGVLRQNAKDSHRNYKKVGAQKQGHL